MRFRGSDVFCRGSKCNGNLNMSMDMELTLFNPCLLSLDLHLKLSLPQGYEANLHPLLIIV